MRAIDINDVNAMRQAMQALQQTMMAAGQAAYSQSTDGNGGGASETPEGAVEGEYREV
jgi:hypothetical protein